MRKKSILFLRSGFKSLNNAPSVNAPRRIKVLKKIGYKIIDYRYFGGNFFRQFISLLRISKNADIVYLRIDGSGSLDKFTLLKLFKPRISVVWEVHGALEEQLEYGGTKRARLRVAKNNIKRFLLSYLVNLHIFISQELLNFYSKRLPIKKSLDIPNFVDQTELQKYKRLNGQDFSTIKFLNKSEFFQIFWGGDPYFNWQAVDLIEKVAKEVYNIDRKIIFIVMGSGSWHEFSWEKNIVKLESSSRDVYLRLVRGADLCLALYKRPKNFPFYFSPLKILDYMSMGKVAIVSKFQTTQALIEDGRNGILVGDSIKDITESILRLRRNPDLIAKIGKNASETISKKHSLEEALVKYKKAMSMLESNI